MKATWGIFVGLFDRLFAFWRQETLKPGTTGVEVMDPLVV